eukprot:CAMPEP_0194225068 /NCGR_PEP_ID=MMETSP0156-20130528/38767_1 /TAXON_ID=33649 /ORGANISM="Thalassionema nitzschioides, Strain L26-B" /LENGTH=385 /DNA_ID=CAMNT_0038956867 /DNA_START=94 /DNA_END=1251 /DNA_ORIENTATION=-
MITESFVLPSSPKELDSNDHMSNNSNNDNEDPLFSFGVISDVQWADREDGENYAKTVKRRYRGAFHALENAVNWWNLQHQRHTPLAFIAQLGDLIDGGNAKLQQSDSALKLALEQLDRAPCHSINLIGNHELYNFDRKYLSSQAQSWVRDGDREYYSFSPSKGWKVMVLDPYQISLIGHAKDDPRRREAIDIMARENKNVDADGSDGDWLVGMEGYNRRFVPYNGGYGKEQLSWIQSELTKAAQAERVIICSHTIIHPMACGGSTLAWDYEEVLDMINKSGCVVAVLCGHDHKGKYFRDENGVHHCTFVSPLNKGGEGHAYGMISIHKDNSMEIRGPKIDDFLPDVQERPPAMECRNDDGGQSQFDYEFIRLELKKIPSSVSSSV